MPAGFTLIVAVAGVLDPPALACNQAAAVVAVNAVLGLLESASVCDEGMEPPNW